MAATFDPYDKSSWYFGPMSRQDATDLLMGEKEGGVFLVRDSTTIHGDFVLCVREDSKVSHYIINKIQQGEQTRYRIGDQMFPDLPQCLAFYKLHYLDTTPLIRPAPRRVEKVMGKYDFEGSDQDDLPFKKGEVLTVLSKDEEQWWTARNSLGQTGSIPVPYIQKRTLLPPSSGVIALIMEAARSSETLVNFYQTTWRYNPEDSHLRTNGRENLKSYLYEDNQQCLSDSHRPGSGGGTVSHQQEAAIRRTNIQRKLPAYARVKQARVPNAYDKTALKLEVGDIIKVTKMNINGQWEGELNGKVGHFPFTHVEFVDSENNDGADES